MHTLILLPLTLSMALVVAPAGNAAPSWPQPAHTISGGRLLPKQTPALPPEWVPEPEKAPEMAPGHFFTPPIGEPPLPSPTGAPDLEGVLEERERQGARAGIEDEELLPLQCEMDDDDWERDQWSDAALFDAYVRLATVAMDMPERARQADEDWGRRLAAMEAGSGITLDPGRFALEQRDPDTDELRAHVARLQADLARFRADPSSWLTIEREYEFRTVEAPEPMSLWDESGSEVPAENGAEVSGYLDAGGTDRDALPVRPDSNSGDSGLDAENFPWRVSAMEDALRFYEQRLERSLASDDWARRINRASIEMECLRARMARLRSKPPPPPDPDG